MNCPLQGRGAREGSIRASMHDTSLVAVRPKRLAAGGGGGKGRWGGGNHLPL